MEFVLIYLNYSSSNDLIEHTPDHAQNDNGRLWTEVSLFLFSSYGDWFTCWYPKYYSPYFVQIQLKGNLKIHFI